MYFVSKRERLRFKDEGEKDDKKMFLHFVGFISFLSLKGFYSLKYIWEVSSYIFTAVLQQFVQSVGIRTVSPEPTLFAHIKYGSRRRVQPKIRDLASLDGCACAIEE